MLCDRPVLFRFLLPFLLLATAGDLSADEHQSAPRPNPGKVTSSVDLRPNFAKFGLAPRQQGQRGACQVFALVGVLEYELAKTGAPADLSEQYLMWAANEANGMNRTEGYNPDYLVKGLGQLGIADERSMPYVPRNEPLGIPSAQAKNHAKSRAGTRLTSIKHWSTPIGFGNDHLSQLRGLLDADQPVTVTLCWPFGIADADIVDEHHFLRDKGIDGTSKNGHGVILVGYALDASVPGGGYFHFRNSWGTGFADGGYAKIDFAMAQKYGTDAYFVSLARSR